MYYCLLIDRLPVDGVRSEKEIDPGFCVPIHTLSFCCCTRLVYIHSFLCTLLTNITAVLIKELESLF